MVDLNATRDNVLPARLADLVALITQGTIGPTPIELPWVNFDTAGLDVPPAIRND